jgi:phosphate transport system protein
MPIFERHAFSGFDKDVRALRDSLLHMRDQCIALLHYTNRIVEDRTDGYSGAKAIDKAINLVEIEVDNKIYQIIAKYTPIGGEMRYVLSMFKVAYIYERLADKIKNSVKRLCRVDKPLPQELIAAIRQMSDVGADMLSFAPSLLDSYKAEDMAKMAELKKTVSLYHKQALQSLQQIPVDSFSVQEMTDLNFAIKNIERVSDLMLDLAKVGYFISTGEKFERAD